MFKKWNRKRLNEKLEGQIEFNKKRIHSFSTIDDDRAEILVTSSISICQIYDDDYLDKIVRKYGVSEELVNESRTTAEIATKEFDKARKRYHEYTKKINERKSVELYKKAILELKSEGLL